MTGTNSAEKSVIVVGASSQRSRYSNKAVRAYLDEGFRVFPVHPKEPEVEGQKAYPTIAAVPEACELLLLYVRPEIGLPMLEEAPGKGVRRVFVNPGTGSPELLQRIRELRMEPIEACAILALGRSPQSYPD